MMPLKRSKPARCNGTGLGIGNRLQARSDPMNTADLAEAQAAFIAGRFGITPIRARLLSGLAWGRL